MRTWLNGLLDKWFPKPIKSTLDNEILSVTWSSGETIQYKGECTVWHEMPMMKRCSTLMESLLSELWEYHKNYGNPYPTAHEK
jgi:hypothetical protein